MFTQAKELITGLSPLTVPYSYIMQNRLPAHGVGAAPFPLTGWTTVFNFTADENYYQINLPFSVKIYGVNYNTLYVGTNNYITFGSGYAYYSNLSSSFPPYRKIFFGAGDASLQRLTTLSTQNYFRIRFEGTSTRTGVPGNPNTVLEFTFYNPIKLPEQKTMIEMLVGKHNKRSGLAMIANQNGSQFTPYTLFENTSYVFLSDINGNNWQIFNNAHVIGVDY